VSDSTVKSDAPVAARAELEEASGEAHQSAVEERVKRQEKQQQDELKAGKSGGADKPHDDIAANRTSPGAHNSVGPQGGLVDNMTARDRSDVAEGTFCTVDRTHKGVDTDLLPEGEDGYGVYLEPAVVGKDGYPETAIVRLRDDTHRTIRVPYESLRPAVAGRR
jgi:hypothetical protein